MFFCFCYYHYWFDASHKELEKPFEQRNIRDALECYKLVISTYPQSDLWDKCDERIKYIQRFYFNIR